MATIVGVRFKEVGKIYYFDPNGLDPQPRDKVIVETAREEGLLDGAIAVAP